MTRHISIAFILLLLFSCNEKPEPKTNSVESNSYLFDGIINGMDSGWLFIGHHDTTGKSFSYMDSSKILNGSFRFTGTISGPDTILFTVDGFLDNSWGFMYSKSGLPMDSTWFNFKGNSIKFVEDINKSWKRTAIR